MISARVLSGDSARVLREYLQNSDSVAAAKNYYEFGAEPGHWLGSLAAEWGLVGEADGMAVELLFDGVHPVTGACLAQRRRADARCGFDFTFSAPKSVSVAAIEDPRIESAFRCAVEAGFAELEQFAARRVRAGEAAWSRDSERTGALAACYYVHRDSRAGDPNLHAHAAIFNVTRCVDGRTYALETGEMMQAIRRHGYGRLAYWHCLARELRQLGYEIERGEHGQPEIKDVSPELRDLFSKRSREMDNAVAAELARRKGMLAAAKSEQVEIPNLRDWLAARGEHWSDLSAKTLSNNEVAVVARTSRREKDHADPTQQREEWREEMGREHRATLQVAVNASMSRRPSAETMTTTDAWNHAVEHVFERLSAAPRHEVLAAALDHSLGECDLGDIKNYCAPHVVAGSGEGIHRLLTTREHLRRERACIAAIDALNDSAVPIAPDFTPDVLQPGESWGPGKLSAAQADVIGGLLRSRHGVTAMRGVAGAGKTSSLTVFDVEARKNGYTTIYLAPTHEAAEVLRQSGFEHVHTVSRFLADPAVREALPEKSIIIADEGGLLSSGQGAALVEVAQAQSTRLVLVGDAAQHASVEAGDWLRTMEQHSRLETHELTEIHRQQHATYRDAAKLMATGNVRAGLEKLDGLGWIVETPEPERAIAADYLAARDAGRDHIAVAPTHAIIRAATDEIRLGLIERGMLGEQVPHSITVSESLNLTTAQKRDVRNYEVGQLVTFTQRELGFTTARAYTVEGIADGALVLRSHTDKRCTINPAAVAGQIDVGRARVIELRPGDKIMLRANDAKARLRNSEVLTFEAITSAGGIKTREGKTIPPGMLSLSYGYVVTSHKSQGQTRGTAGMVGGFDAKAIYVSATRAKQAVRIYTSDKQALFRAAERPGSRIAAVEALISKPLTPQPQKMKTQNTPHRDYHWQAAQKMVTEALQAWQPIQSAGATEIKRRLESIQLDLQHEVGTADRTARDDLRLLKDVRRYAAMRPDGVLSADTSAIDSGIATLALQANDKTATSKPSAAATDELRDWQQRQDDLADRQSQLGDRAHALRVRGEHAAADKHEQGTLFARVNLARERMGLAPLSRERFDGSPRTRRLSAAIRNAASGVRERIADIKSTLTHRKANQRTRDTAAPASAPKQSQHQIMERPRDLARKAAQEIDLAR